MTRFTLTALVLVLSTVAPAFAQDAPAEPAPPVGICYYAGLEYSQWAALPNGQICQPGGMWSYPNIDSADAPPTDAPAAG